MSCELKRKVILDTDIGIDSCEAIIYLTSCKDIDLLAITLVSGTSPMSTTFENARRILSFLHKEDIPLYQSGSYNLFADCINTNTKYGQNGFADIQLPQTNYMPTNVTVPAAIALIDYVRKYPNQVHLICIGPLTNIALACFLDNEFPKLLASITIVGGNNSCEKTKCSSSKNCEINTYTDPVSYLCVDKFFKSLKISITIIDLQTCKSHYLHSTMFIQLYQKSKTQNRHIELLSIITDYNNNFIAKKHCKEGYQTSKLYAVCGWHDPTIFITKRKVILEKISLERETEIRGYTIFEESKNGVYELVLEINVEKMETNIIQKLTKVTIEEKIELEIDLDKTKFSN